MHKIFSVVTVAIAALAMNFEAGNAAPKKEKYLYLMGSTPQGTAPIVVAIKKGFCKNKLLLKHGKTISPYLLVI